MDLTTYIITEFIFTLCIDLLIRELESSEPFTIIKIPYFWYFMLFFILKEFFKNRFKCYNLYLYIMMLHESQYIDNVVCLYLLKRNLNKSGESNN